MLYEVYIDVFFAVNALLNLPVLILVKQLQHYKSSKLRMVLAAMAGSAILSVLVCMPARKYVPVRFCAYAGAYGIMAWTAFPDNRGRELPRSAVALYLAGLVSNGIFRWLSMKIEHVPQLAAGCIAVYVIALESIRAYERLQSREQEIYEVGIRYQGKEIHMRGLWDTGNRLRSPYHNKGISVVNYDSMREYMSESMRKCIETENGLTESGGKERLYYVPYETVSQKHGLLPVIEAEQMWIRKEKGTLEYRKPLLGISRLPVSSQGTFQIVLTVGG